MERKTSHYYNCVIIYCIQSKGIWFHKACKKGFYVIQCYLKTRFTSWSLETKGTTQSKNWRRKYLWLAPSKENTKNLSWINVTQNSTIGEVLSWKGTYIFVKRLRSSTHPSPGYLPNLRGQTHVSWLACRFLTTKPPQFPLGSRWPGSWALQANLYHWNRTRAL